MPGRVLGLESTMSTGSNLRTSDGRVSSAEDRCANGNRCRPSWTSRFLDPEGRESATPFPRWRATFLLRDMAHQAAPCHFAKEIKHAMCHHAKSHVCSSDGSDRGGRLAPTDKDRRAQSPEMQFCKTNSLKPCGICLLRFSRPAQTAMLR